MANPFSPLATKWSTGDKLLPSLAASTATCGAGKGGSRCAAPKEGFPPAPLLGRERTKPQK